jgi:glycerophosphoryl diester phosphodiesterase
MTRPIIIAHRGDSSNALENSLEAILRALMYPVDMIELDIRKSRDNALYVMHDKSTKRTAGKDIDVEQSGSGDIAGVLLRNGQPIPTLADALQTVSGKAGLNLELKSEGSGLLTAEHLLSSGYTGYVLVSSFKEDEVQAVRRLMPQAPVSVIFDVFSARDVPAYTGKGYSIVSLRKTTVSQNLIEACRAGGVQVYVWTVDEEEEMKKFISWGVNGIYTNRPGSLKQVVESIR